MGLWRGKGAPSAKPSPSANPPTRHTTRRSVVSHCLGLLLPALSHAFVGVIDAPSPIPFLLLLLLLLPLLIPSSSSPAPVSMKELEESEGEMEMKEMDSL
mmetsp:Transcript_5565/g.15532  ORF Transcript_5565/g.15532 Transcript_5565/m.15532 type:complete len:100 (+) Transcript_5565:506-805(+)